MTGIEVTGEFEFSKSSIAYMVETVEELANGWTQQTSGIALPTKGLVK